MNYNIWITSDTHYAHKNIVRGCSNWGDTSGCRNFNSLDQHNQTLVDMINKYVQPNDVLYHLGDWSFGGIDKIWEFRKKLYVKQIHLLYGNHDHHIRANKDLIIPEEDKDLARIIANGFYVDPLGKMTVPAQELFESTNYLLDAKINGHRLTMCHYSMRTWYYHNKGSMMLFGHSHDSLRPEGKTMDVGVDSANRILGTYRPFKFQEIQKIMANRDVHFNDHHEQRTNAR